MFCKLTRIITRWYALCVRLRVKEKALPSHRMIDLHITLDGVNAVINWFWSHPFHRKLLRILSTVHVFVDLSHQPKVWHFNSVITANQNITSCKVTMNKTFLCEMILKNYERIKENNLFIEIMIMILFLFWTMYSILLRGSLKLLINQARKTHLRRSDDLLRNIFLWRSRVTKTEYLNNVVSIILLIKLPRPRNKSLCDFRWFV